MADHPAGHQEAESVDRIGRIGADDRIAGRGNGHGEVGEAFLGTERGDDFGIRIEFDAVAAVIIAGHGLAQALDAFRD